MLFENVILAFGYLVSGQDHVLLRDPAHTGDGRHQPLALMDKGLQIKMLEQLFFLYLASPIVHSNDLKLFSLKSPQFRVMVSFMCPKCIYICTLFALHTYTFGT